MKSSYYWQEKGACITDVALKILRTDPPPETPEGTIVFEDVPVTSYSRE